MRRRSTDGASYELTRSPSSAATIRAFNALFTANDSWFDADAYEVDGVSGKVAAFVDRCNTARKLVQAVSGSQVAIPTANLSFNGRLAATFTAQQYVSNQASSFWKFLHDGTGSESVHVLIQTASGAGYVFGTGGAAALVGGSQVGAALACSATQLFYRAANGAANIFNSTPTGGFAQNAPTYLTATFIDGSSPEHRLFARASSLATGDSTAAPSVADPNATLAVGTDGAGGFPGGFVWRASLFFKRVLTTAERKAVQDYLLLTTGVPA